MTRTRRAVQLEEGGKLVTYIIFHLPRLELFAWAQLELTRYPPQGTFRKYCEIKFTGTIPTPRCQSTGTLKHTHRIRAVISCQPQGSTSTSARSAKRKKRPCRIDHCNGSIPNIALNYTCDLLVPSRTESKLQHVEIRFAGPHRTTITVALQFGARLDWQFRLPSLADRLGGLLRGRARRASPQKGCGGQSLVSTLIALRESRQRAWTAVIGRPPLRH